MYRYIVLFVLFLAIQGFHIQHLHKNKVSTLSPNSYPIRAVYIDRNAKWYGDKIAPGLGVPGYAASHDYNYILLAFWSCNSDPKDMALIWANASQYFGPANSFGNDTQSIQKALKKLYNDAGIKIMVSAFGST